jgi:hypothetical protein
MNQKCIKTYFTSKFTGPISFFLKHRNAATTATATHETIVDELSILENQNQITKSIFHPLAMLA